MAGSSQFRTTLFSQMGVAVGDTDLVRLLPDHT